MNSTFVIRSSYHLPKAATVLIKVMVIDKLMSPPKRMHQKFEAVPPGQHPSTNKPRRNNMSPGAKIQPMAKENYSEIKRIETLSWSLKSQSKLHTKGIKINCETKPTIGPMGFLKTALMISRSS